MSSNWDEAKRMAAPLLTYCKEHGLYVVEADASPIANVFPTKVDKGEAFDKLKRELGVTGPIIFLGDSEADDPAFQHAEVSIGVKHRRIMPKLQCKYRIEFFELENLLTKLIDSDYDFQENMATRNVANDRHCVDVSTGHPRFPPGPPSLNLHWLFISMEVIEN